MTFVSPSCAISVEDAPSFVEVAQANPTVTFVFVHTDGNVASFQEFIDQADLYEQNMIHINDSDLTLWTRFGIDTQPSTLLVDQMGRASLTEGGLGHEGLATAVQLLGAAS